MGWPAPGGRSRTCRTRSCNRLFPGRILSRKRDRRDNASVDQILPGFGEVIARRRNVAEPLDQRYRPLHGCRSARRH